MTRLDLFKIIFGVNLGEAFDIEDAVSYWEEPLKPEDIDVMTDNIKAFIEACNIKAPCITNKCEYLEACCGCDEYDKWKEKNQR